MKTMIATKRLLLPLLIYSHLTLLRAEENQQPPNNTAGTQISDSFFAFHPFNQQLSLIPPFSPSRGQGQGPANQNTDLAKPGQGTANQNTASSPLEKIEGSPKLTEGQYGTSLQTGHQDTNGQLKGLGPERLSPSQAAKETLRKIFQQMKNAQESLRNENRGGAGDSDGNKTGLATSPTLDHISYDLDPLAGMAKVFNNNADVSDKEIPGMSETGNPNNQGTDTKEPEPQLKMKVSEFPNVHGKPQSADIKPERSRQSSKSLNATSNGFRAKDTLSNLKYAMLAICMVIVAVAVMVLAVFSTANRRRRRQYDRCRGLGDDCEMHSNFQLVNNDERLGIRTSSNYLM